MPIRRGKMRLQVRRHIRQDVADRGEGRRFERFLESAIADARRRWRDRVVGCCSILGKLEEFLSDSRAGLGRRRCGPGTLTRHRRRLKAFDRAFHSRPLDAVDRRTLERWIKRRLKTVMPATVNMELASLRAFIRWAQKKGYAPDVLPLLLVDRVDEPGKLPGANRLPPKALEMGELLRTIDAFGTVRPDIALFLEGMAIYGLRPVEVAGLRRDHYKQPRGDDVGRLHVRGVKGHPDRDIPIPKDSPGRRWLDRCLALGAELGQDSGRRPLVPCMSKRSALRPGGWTSDSLGAAIRRVRRALRLSFNAYLARHTCVSWLQAQGLTIAEVQGYANHTTPTTQTAYSHRHAREAVKAYDIIGQAFEDHRRNHSK